MNRKSLFLILAIAASVTAVISLMAMKSTARTVEVAAPTAYSVIQDGAWEYAQLVVGTDNRVTWVVGNTNQLPRAETIASTNRRLGGKQPRADLANLLNTIGINGWELVQVNGNTWIFKRPVRV